MLRRVADRFNMLRLFPRFFCLGPEWSFGAVCGFGTLIFLPIPFLVLKKTVGTVSSFPSGTDGQFFFTCISGASMVPEKCSTCL